jgi:hypothetical protein
MGVPSLKLQQCPFENFFHWIKPKKHVAKKAKLLLHLKLTFCNPPSYLQDRHTLPSDGSTEGWMTLSLDFGKEKSLLFLLFEKAGLDNNTLRPYLGEALTHC